MSKITTKRVRKWVTVGMVLVLAVSLVTWFAQRERLPRQVRIATGPLEGLYHKVGVTISGPLEQRVRRSVSVLESHGSEDNLRMLVGEDAELAIVQGGAGAIEKVSVVTPLFREFVFVIARNGTNIEKVGDLSGKKVWIGQSGSGNRDAAFKVLSQFKIDESDLIDHDDHSWKSLAEDKSIDAAIVTAGVEHPTLRALLSTDEFAIVPIQSAPAMELVHPFIRSVEVPRGLFSEHPPVPSEPIPTIATTAYLVCRNDAPDRLVEAALETIHEESLRLKVPTLIARQDAPQWTATRMHPTAQRYFNPEDSLGAILNVMESLVATKELLFAFGAGIYLLWIRWRRLKEKEIKTRVHMQKQHLERLLMETLRIEREQMQTENIDQLQEHLKSVMRIKVRALQELTGEDLRSNQEFSIFLDQCSTLISSIQMKILSQHAIRENLQN